MRKPFQPIGDEAMWRPVYDWDKAATAGTIITYDDLAALVGHDVKADRYPIREAMRHLEQDAHKTLAVVRRIGYRVAEPAEHITLARQHQKRARRQTKRALGRTGSVDRSALTVDERARIDALELNLQRQSAFLGRLADRVERVEMDQTGAVVVSEHHEKRIAALESSLAKFNGDVNPLAEKAS